MKKGLRTAIFVSLVVAGAGYLNYYALEKGKEEFQKTSIQQPQQKTVDEKTSITLYFLEKETGQLKDEKRAVKLQEILKKPEATIVNELLKGPMSSDLLPTIPQGTVVNSVKKEGDVVTVDLSKEFVDNHPGGSAGESITLYSIVNSLTELKDVEKVQFLIDGKIKEEYKGHYRFDIPLERNEDIIKR